MSTELYTGVALLMSRRAERRFDARRRLADGLPGTLITDQGMRPKILTADVAIHGLGILTLEALAVGAVMVWVIGGEAYKLDVVWCEREAGAFRVGLHSRALNVDLNAVALAALQPAPSVWDPSP